MEFIAALRGFFKDVRRKYFPKKASLEPITEGYPEGLDPDRLQELVKQHFNGQVRSVGFIHLSGWKSEGAYRLFIQLINGNAIRIIYKNALYSNDQIPALMNLPIIPGPPEYTIYKNASGELLEYLPTVYLVEEVIPGQQYHYFLEDLLDNYRTVYTNDEVQRAASLLPGFHQALAEWASSSNTEGLIHFGESFSLALQNYALSSLESYSQKTNDPMVKEVLNHWSKIETIHLHPDLIANQPYIPIHGDTNFTNIHLHRNHPQKIKLVDWEWAGFGSPYSDLASLLKGTSGYVQKASFQCFSKPQTVSNPCLNSHLSMEENWRLFRWCCLERGLLDASFLAAQYLKAIHTPTFSLPGAISQSLARVMNAYQQLS